MDSAMDLAKNLAVYISVVLPVEKVRTENRAKFAT